MGLRATTIKLTIFTLVTIAITTWLATIIGNFQLFASPYAVKAEFRDASGLLVGDVVKAAGVTVGRVSAIEIDNGLAVVTITIEEGTEIPSNVEAAIRFRNLIGQRMITLVASEEPSGDLLADGARIPFDRTESAFDLTVLFNGLRPLIRSTSAEDINIVSTELVKALRGRGGDIEGILANIADVSDVIVAKDDELANLLEGLNTVTADLSNRDAQLQATFADMAAFLDDVAASKEDLAAAIDNLDQAATIFGRIIEANDERIAGELDDLADILDAVKDKRRELRQAVRLLPGFAIAVQRASDYGEWGNQHLIDVCKDDLGTCGTRGTP